MDVTPPGRSRWRWFPDLHRLREPGVVRRDLSAGLVLGLESVPDGLARGALVATAPLSGLYGYLFGMVAAALLAASPLMIVQATGALAVVVADVDLAGFADPARALCTVTVLTGVILAVGGALRAGHLMRFVSTAVLTGFVTAVGLTIVLSQLDTLTGTDLGPGGRVVQTLRLLAAPAAIDPASLLVGAVTIALVVWLTRTRLGALGMVVAVAVGSALAAVSGRLGQPVELLGDLVPVPGALPGPVLPSVADVPALLLPALSLAFVGAVQGAGVSAAVSRPADGPVDLSRDVAAQGLGNVVAGLFQGMPVGGSMSASALATTAGGRTRLVPLSAGLVMVLIVLLLGGLVGYVAMPALAGLLIVVGAGSIRPAQVASVMRMGLAQSVVLVATFVLTVVIPLQFAVLVGVGLAAGMHVIRQSVRVTLVQLHIDPGGPARETAPVAEVPAMSVVVLQPYGSIFFASASALESRLPSVTPDSRDSVVIIRLRGVEDAGATFLDVVDRYAVALRDVGSRLVLVVNNDRLLRQLRISGALATVGEENVYRGNEWVGRVVRRAHRDALRWVADRSG